MAVTGRRPLREEATVEEPSAGLVAPPRRGPRGESRRCTGRNRRSPVDQKVSRRGRRGPARRSRKKAGNRPVRALLDVFHWQQRAIVLAIGLNSARNNRSEGIPQLGEFREQAMHHVHVLLEGLASV